MMLCHIIFNFFSKTGRWCSQTTSRVSRHSFCRRRSCGELSQLLCLTLQDLLRYKGSHVFRLMSAFPTRPTWWSSSLGIPWALPAMHLQHHGELLPGPPATVRPGHMTPLDATGSAQVSRRCCQFWGSPKDHLNVRILPKPMVSGIALILGLRSRMWDPDTFMWSTGPAFFHIGESPYRVLREPRVCKLLQQEAALLLVSKIHGKMSKNIRTLRNARDRIDSIWGVPLSGATDMLTIFTSSLQQPWRCARSQKTELQGIQQAPGGPMR